MNQRYLDRCMAYLLTLRPPVASTRQAPYIIYMAGAVQIQTINHRHRAIMDLMIAEPQLSKSEIARRLEYSIPWVCNVTNSNLFKAQFEEAYAAHFEHTVIPLAAKMRGMAEMAVEQTIDNLASGDLNAKETGDIALKALQLCGFGNKNESPVNTQVNVVINTDILEEAQRRLNA